MVRFGRESRAPRTVRLAMSRSLRGVLCICGLPGVGKTHVASAVSKDTGLRVLSTDALRRQDLENAIPLRETERYYLLLVAALGRTLSGGEGCLLDATFSERKWRDEVARVVAAYDAASFLLELRAPEALARKRISKRQSPQEGVTDTAVYVSIKQRFEPI